MDLVKYKKRKKEILRLKNTGKSLAWIGRKYRVTYQRIQQITMKTTKKISLKEMMKARKEYDENKCRLCMRGYEFGPLIVHSFAKRGKKIGFNDLLTIHPICLGGIKKVQPSIPTST